MGGGGGRGTGLFKNAPAAPGKTFLGSSANPVGAVLAQPALGLSEEEQQRANIVLDPGGALTEETFFKDTSVELPTPETPALNQLGQREISAAAKRAREEEKRKRAGGSIFSRTLKTGPQGVTGGASRAFETILGA